MPVSSNYTVLDIRILRFYLYNSVMRNYKNKLVSSMLLESKANVIQQVYVLPSIVTSRWQVDKSHVNYKKNDSHTLSMYIKGGESSYRTDKPRNKGAPGKLVLMPQGHESSWDINGKIEFVHLYFTDKAIKHFAISHFDSDVRHVNLQDLTYENDLTLQRLLGDYISYCEAETNLYSLFAEETLGSIFYRLIANYNDLKLKQHRLYGGLSPFHRKKIKSEISTMLGEKLSIEHLANVVNLSPFHFARMFKLSFGDSPAQYINQRRIEQVKLHLRSSLRLAEISLLTGFNQQSHMSHHFKKLTGVTPGMYRQLCN